MSFVVNGVGSAGVAVDRGGDSFSQSGRGVYLVGYSIANLAAHGVGRNGGR